MESKTWCENVLLVTKIFNEDAANIILYMGPTTAAPNHGKAWLSDEKQSLMQEVADGKQLDEIVALHGRTVWSIRCKLLDVAEQMKQQGNLGVVEKIRTILGIVSDNALDDEIQRIKKGDEERGSKRRRVEMPVVQPATTMDHNHHAVMSLLLDLKSKMLDLEGQLIDIRRMVERK
jgi:hypothetical protein